MAMTAADRGREVRRRLLGAAVELIAERAGVAPGLVHYHLASVQALLSEAAVGPMRETATLLEPALAQARTPDAAVAALDPYTGHDPVSVLFAETYLAATRDPGLRDAVAEVIAEFRTRLATWFGDGAPSPAATAAVVGAAVDGLVMQRALDPTLTADTITPVLARLLTGTERTHSWH